MARRFLQGSGECVLVVQGRGLTSQNHKESSNVENVGWEVGHYVVHLILLPRLVLYHVEKDVNGRV